MISKKKIKFIITTLFFAMADILITNGVICHAANQTIECIDTPNVNYSTAISSTNLNIGGWALSDGGVKQVKILVDGNFSGYASIGESRPDVAKAFPSYSDGSTSGYSYVLDVSKLSAANHKLTVETIGNNGTIVDEYRNFSTYAEVAMTDIDTPSQSSTYYTNQIRIGGWALNPSGVKSVQIYCDNNLEGQAEIGRSRPDVQAVFQGYSGANTSGYSYNLDETQLPSGSHTVKVVSTGNDGSTQSVSRQINGAGLLDCVDFPQQNKAYGSSINVAGWAMDPSGISKIQVYVDGNYVEDAILGNSRPDVANVFPNYKNNATSGYRTALNISSLPNGNHKVTLKFIAVNGDTDSKDVQIQKGLPARTCMDTPKGMINGSGTSVFVGGWALNSSGIKQVNVLVDNNQVGTASIGDSRPDVANVFPDYNNTASGYHYNLDVSHIGGGTHTITIQAIGNDGSTNSVSTSITRPNNIMCIDFPRDLQNVNNTVAVAGWALDITGIKEVDILVDGQNVGTATTGVARPDVNNVYPAYNNTTSGYKYNLDVSHLGGGTHTITVQVIGNDGSTNSESRSITRPGDIMCIDCPKDLQNVNNSIYVSGWALDMTGIKEVDILVDGQNVGTATTGVARPDVNNIYPVYNIGNSGFNYSLDVSKFSNGVHRITVNCIGNNGQTVSQSVLVTVGTLSTYNGADVYEGDDISDYQQFKSSGVQVVIQKATQGETFTDSLLQYRATNLTKYGFLVGYYHYANNDSQPDAQAQHFLDAINGLHSDTVLWLDIENEADWNKQQAVDFTKEFISYVQARGYKIGIYSDMNFYNDYLADSDFNVPTWIASYGPQPSQYPSVSWQYTNTGTINGVTGNIDLDWFNNLIFN
jgi:GH25 family lysozyme M1 (1,4-beta-N-acetylmuramidase)